RSHFHYHLAHVVWAAAPLARKLDRLPDAGGAIAAGALQLFVRRSVASGERAVASGDIRQSGDDLDALARARGRTRGRASWCCRRCRLFGGLSRVALESAALRSGEVPQAKCRTTRLSRSSITPVRRRLVPDYARCLRLSSHRRRRSVGRRVAPLVDILRRVFA